MIGKEMLRELNQQINEELYSAYIYQAMSAYMDSEGWKGMAKWLDEQAKEEQKHARKFYDFILDRNEKVELLTVKAPPVSWKGPLDVFKGALKHEQHITGRINKLTDIAIKDKDHATKVMLHWFVAEQVEEEKNTQEIVDQLEKTGDHVGGLFQIDHRLGKREG